jgi:hypothetical protein
MRTCREVAAILVAREDRALSLPDRLALRMHMAHLRRLPPLRAPNADDAQQHAPVAQLPPGTMNRSTRRRCKIKFRKND